jgi:hypothetical protein
LYRAERSTEFEMFWNESAARNGDVMVKKIVGNIDRRPHRHRPLTDCLCDPARLSQYRLELGWLDWGRTDYHGPRRDLPGIQRSGRVDLRGRHPQVLMQ